jgi:hypothetical protein
MALTNVPAEVIGSQILIFNSGGAQIRRYISNVVHLTKVKSEERRVKNPIALLVCFTRTTFAYDFNS